MRRSLWILLSVAVLVVWGPLAFSQPEPKKPGPRVPAGAPEVSLIMTPGREAAALKFAQLHHPELEKLLVHLEKSNPAEYKRAVRRLYQDSERLARTAERSPERHELELDAWKLDSRIRLLVARMSMSDNVELDGQLKSLLHERVQLRLQQLQSERERLQARLANIDESISQIESDPEAAAIKDLQRVKRSLGIPANRPGRAPDRPRAARASTRPFANADADQPGRNPKTER